MDFNLIQILTNWFQENEKTIRNYVVFIVFSVSFYFTWLFFYEFHITSKMEENCRYFHKIMDGDISAKQYLEKENGSYGFFSRALSVCNLNSTDINYDEKIKSFSNEVLNDKVEFYSLFVLSGYIRDKNFGNINVRNKYLNPWNKLFEFFICGKSRVKPSMLKKSTYLLPFFVADNTNITDDDFEHILKNGKEFFEGED